MAITTNKNYLSPTGFQLKINSQKYGNLEYFATTVTLPSLTLEPQPMNYKTVDMDATGSRLKFGDLAITIQVTENFDNYLEVFNWMHDLQGKTGVEAENLKEDAVLLVFTSHNNINKTIRFKDIFPTSIGELEFTSSADSVVYLNTSINFSYTSFEFE